MSMTYNILFGFVTSLLPLLFLLLVWRLTPLHKEVPKSRALAAVGVYVGMVLMYSIAAYGPRVEVSSPLTSGPQYRPEARPVEPQPEIFGQHQNRIGQFNSDLQEWPLAPGPREADE